MNQGSQLSNGHHSSLAHERHAAGGSLSVATGCNGLEQDGNNDLSLRRPQEEPSSMVQSSAERIGAGSPINFNDQLAISPQYRLSTIMPERNPFLDATDADRGTKRNASSRPATNPPRIGYRPTAAEENQGVFLGNSISVSPVDLNNGLLSFLATMDLPLAAAKSKGVEALFTAARLQLHIPDLSRLHSGMLIEQKREMCSKIRNLLADAEKLVIVIEAAKTSHNVFCRYLKRGLVFGHLCLEVLPIDDQFTEDENETKASESDIFPLSSNLETNPVARGLERRSRLLNNVNKILEDWDIREKTTAVVISEGVLYAEANQFHLQRKPTYPVSGRDGSDSLRSARQVPLFLDNHKESELLCSVSERIPVISCIASVVEAIVADTICESDLVKQNFIEPMSRGMFKALADNTFLDAENVQSRPVTLKLPLSNLSMEDMLSMLGYFISHLDLLQTVLKRKGDTSDIDILRMRKRDLTFLQTLLLAFSESLRDIRTVKHGAVFRSELISIALPAMNGLLKKVETIYREVSEPLKNEPLKKVALDVFQAVKHQRDAMESQDIYICATLLDPRFKGEYFTSKDVAAVAEASINDAYERERQRQELRRHPKESAGNLQNIMEAPRNVLDRYMDSMRGRSMLSNSLSTYLHEPLVERIEDIETYWRQQQQKWPELSAVAAQYALVPCVCETEKVHSVLGDFRRFDSSIGNGTGDSFSLSFLKNNILLVDSNAMY